MKRSGFDFPGVVAALLLALLLAGCSTTADKDNDANQNAATVEDRSMTGSGSGDDDGGGATSQGLDDDVGFSAASLDDPNSPLSIRVIYFDYDSATIRSEFSDAIATHASYLAANPDASLTLEGHADERGSREYNLALGERRALTVRRQLVLLGASAGQINAVSYGEERPAVDGHDEQAYGMSRRVELIY